MVICPMVLVLRIVSSFLLPFDLTIIQTPARHSRAYSVYGGSPHPSFFVVQPEYHQAFPPTIV